MSTLDRYPEPMKDTKWNRPQSFETAFTWEYDDGRDKLLNLYRKGKKLQWDAAERIDWSQDLDPENPAGLPDAIIPIYGSEIWHRLTTAEQARVRTHFQAWQISQFLELLSPSLQWGQNRSPIFPSGQTMSISTL